ncbi:MAG: glycogen/starch synthase, partial [Candidatus Omnitrophica bacterium]|nr:glycogen/starch synthase [Candidatus Omnitrophota bacterium]
VRMRPGGLQLETPLGDFSYLLAHRGIYRQGATVKDFKAFNNLPLALETAGKQDKASSSLISEEDEVLKQVVLIAKLMLEAKAGEKEIVRLYDDFSIKEITHTAVTSWGQRIYPVLLSLLGFTLLRQLQEEFGSDFILGGYAWGSLATGMAVESSDVDFMIHVSNVGGEKDDEYCRVVKRLRELNKQLLVELQEAGVDIFQILGFDISIITKPAIGAKNVEDLVLQGVDYWLKNETKKDVKKILEDFKNENIAFSSIDSIQRQAYKVQRAGKKVIVFVAMEGWSKKGGQANYVRELSQALVEAGHMVLVVNPYFKEGHGDISLEKGVLLLNIGVPLGKGEFKGEVFYSNLEGVHYLRVKDKGDLLYPIVYPETKIDGKSYCDSLYGYIEAVILSQAPMLIVKELGIKPDILHFNDWQVGLGPVYMETIYRNHSQYRDLLAKTGTVIITHNLAYQGLFAGRVNIARKDPLAGFLIKNRIISVKDSGLTKYYLEIDTYSLTNLPLHLQHQTKGGLEYWSYDSEGRLLSIGKHNFLKGGLEFAQMIVAVSKGNSKEIQTDRLGFGLGGVIARRAGEGVVAGIYNGLRLKTAKPDSLEELKEVVDKEKDIRFKQFTKDDPDLMQKRENNKRVLQIKINRLIAQESKKPVNEQKCFGKLEENKNVLMVTAVTRLAMQKGLSLLFTSLEVSARGGAVTRGDLLLTGFMELDEDNERGIKQGERLIDLILNLRGPDNEKVQLVIMGTPQDPDGGVFVKKMREFAQENKQSGQVAFLEKFDSSFAKQIDASGDNYAMPSWYEPAGTGNTEAAVKGSLGIVTYTGGLIDFVEMRGTHPDFIAPAFDYGDPASMKRTVLAMYNIFQLALRMRFKQPKLWEEWVRKAMNFENDWSLRIPEYIQLYDNAQELVRPLLQRYQVEIVSSPLTSREFRHNILGKWINQAAADVNRPLYNHLKSLFKLEAGMSFQASLELKEKVVSLEEDIQQLMDIINADKEYSSLIREGKAFKVEDIPELEDYRIKVKNLLREGKIAFVDLSGGMTTRLGLGSMYPIDIVEVA